MPDISIVNFDPITGEVSLGLGNTPRVIDGMDLLKQIVVLAYLRNPGQSVIDPDEGSGVRAAIGQYNFVEGDEIKVLFIQRTQAIEQEIIGRQEGATTAPEERLKKLVVIDVAFDETTNSVAGRTQIINQAGDTSDIIV